LRVPARAAAHRAASTHGRTAPPRARSSPNNKGNPVKQYEPFFSATSDFEDEDAIVATGVTSIIYYDPLDRVIRTDFPDGSFSKVEFDSWKQANWDQNDTVLESQWYVDRGSPPPSGPEPSAPETRAAWLAAQHANTPTTAYLDTLGRPFLSVAHNRTKGIDELYSTHTDLDIEGNTLAIFDARQIKRHEANPAVPLVATIVQTLTSCNDASGSSVPTRALAWRSRTLPVNRCAPGTAAGRLTAGCSTRSSAPRMSTSKKASPNAYFCARFMGNL